MRLYLAGPMRGIRWFNFPAFLEAGFRLRALGHEVFNPAEHDITLHGYEAFQVESGQLDDIEVHPRIPFDLRDSLAADLAFICQESDGVVVLDGWQQSSGAKAEVATAQALGLPVFTVVSSGLNEIRPSLTARTVDPEIAR